MTTSTLTAGSDNVVPVYDPSARWCVWNINEIFVPGGVGTNRYVPKVNDLVEDISNNITYIVTAVNLTTLQSTLVQYRDYSNNSILLSAYDILTGPGPGTYRIYVDTSVSPAVLAIDARLKIYGSMASYAQIFLGEDTSVNGTVIGFLTDSGGNITTQNITLELASTTTGVNYTTKTINVCYTNQALADGETVTVVVYSDTGNVVSMTRLLVVNTSFIRTLAASTKYITSIGLQSSFLSSTDSTVLDVPLNTPIDSITMMGVVNYNTGSPLVLPVDGTTFAMLGMENYVSTVVGQRIPLLLKYTLGAGEVAYSGTNYNGTIVTAPYSLLTTTMEGTYTVKLFAYPVWVDFNTGYRLEWFLYNLDRNVWYDVTSLVSLNPNSAVFNPTSYGVLQNISVRINLNDVSASFKSYIHIQTIGITLLTQGTQRTTNWNVEFSPGQSPQYGNNVYAKMAMVSSNSYNVQIDSGFPDVTTWLTNLYYNTQPLINPLSESVPPTPNYFCINAGGNLTYFPISSWNAVLNVPAGPVLNGTLFVQFLQRTVNGDIVLAVAGMPTYSM